MSVSRYRERLLAAPRQVRRAWRDREIRFRRRPPVHRRHPEAGHDQPRGQGRGLHAVHHAGKPDRHSGGQAGPDHGVHDRQAEGEGLHRHRHEAQLHYEVTAASGRGAGRAGDAASQRRINRPKGGFFVAAATRRWQPRMVRHAGQKPDDKVAAIWTRQTRRPCPPSPHLP